MVVDDVTDAVAVKDFVESLEIHKGIIVADRGFRPEVMKDVAETHDGLHYLVPLMKGRKVAETTGCYTYDTVISVEEGPVSCRKCKAIDENGEYLGYWLYSYKDPRIAAEMESAYLEQNARNLDSELLEAERRWFGLMILQSDLELDLKFAYDCYDDRWGIEPLFKLHKTGLEIDDTREKSDETAIGSEFVNFIATLMAAKLRKHLGKFDFCANKSYKDILSDLRDCVKVRKDNGDWEYRMTTANDMKFYVNVGAVSEKELVELYGDKQSFPNDGPHKCGRPKGSKDSFQRTRRSAAELLAAKSKST